MSTGSHEARRRVQVSETGAALLKMGTTDAVASVLLAKLVQVVAEEAARTPRFAKAIASALTVAAGEEELAVPMSAPAPPPVKKRATPRRPKRSPGAFDPFEVFKELGEEALTVRLSSLDLDGLKDIIAEQELDTHKEIGRKRNTDLIVVWVVERVKTLASKGDAFR